MINGLGYYTGVVEDRDDPLRLGRCRVRVVGLHTENKSILPTEQLPWAIPLQPITSAAMNGIGWTPTGPVLGTWVVIIFRDPEQQEPIMIGTFGGIPQTKAAQQANNSNSDIIASNSGVLVDSEGNPVKTADGIPITVGTVEAGNNSPTAPAAAPEPAITEQKVPNQPPEAALKSDIPTDPPPNSTPNPKEAKQNIQYLLDACDRLGLTSKYAKCAILGICGGETGWLPIGEYTYYTASALMRIFGRTFPAGSEAEAEQYAKWNYKVKGREDFFRKIYNPTGNGYLVGNTQADDGAKYYGRGYNQLTGRAGYLQIEKFLKSKGVAIDLMNNPDSLLNDPQTAALACVAFYSLNVKHNQNDPGYFVAARARTGADAGGGYAKKQKYYEYFLGASVAADPTNKPFADENKVYTPEQVKDLPVSKQVALLETRTENELIGFCDPNGKYPLRNLMDEPDTNRLARGVVKETAIEFKDSVRTKQIPLANTTQTWEQPIAPFGGKYPYSKVYETESGHLQVFDDTPTHETISLYHKKGTFTDIDANGTQVNKIVGDGYTIIDRNGSIYIAGAAKLTVGNSVNILVQGMADIQVQGATVLNVNNNVDIGVAGNLNVAVGGDYNVNVLGTHRVTANAMEIFSKTDIIEQAANNLEFTAGESLNSSASEMNIKADSYNETVGTSNYRWEGDKYTWTGANTYERHAGGVDNSNPADPSRAPGTAAGTVASASTAVPTTPLGIVPPENIGFTSDQYQYLTTPVRPSPPVELKFSINEENRLRTEDYVENPDKYKNVTAAENGVKENYPGTPTSDGQGQPLKSDAEPTDIYEFLRKQLELTAQNGYWRETGQNGNTSNPNITRIWADLGYPTSAPWNTDQTAWCMGFVNYTLKQCGYRYVQEAGARAIATNPSRWGATKVEIADAQPGDIVLWNFGHVNFVYTAVEGKLSFVGGNQSPKNKGNNPNDGDVTQSWPGGWTEARGGIVGIYRPSKA